MKHLQNLPYFFCYRVNGVKINYFPEQWSWICSKRLCTTKFFELKSSVQFIQVPVIWHYQNTSKFWILQRLNLCEGDICWSDIFYPFTHMKDGDQVAFATMWGLTLIPCGLYLIWFLRGFWWKRNNAFKYIVVYGRISIRIKSIKRQIFFFCNYDSFLSCEQRNFLNRKWNGENSETIVYLIWIYLLCSRWKSGGS